VAIYRKGVHRRHVGRSGDKEISLEDYVANMKEDQKNIYYISGEKRKGAVQL
jgi:heat shock protein beta